MKRSRFILGFAALLTLSACGTAKVAGDVGGQFWQRTASSDSLYMRGPKAQQILNRDISRCVVELRELERLGTLKNAIPTDLTGHVLTQDELEVADWDSPERDKHLFAEHSDYHDFETCMGSKGWERVEHVPYDTANKGRENYLAAHVDYGEENMPQKSKKRMSTQTHGDYGNLNAFKANNEPRGFND